jgi:formylglycine-generating enzyme required for sulfatase activity
MSGNVREWCFDLAGALRRIRGGSWNDDVGFAAVAFRDYSHMPGKRSNGLGFRLARSSGN